MTVALSPVARKNASETYDECKTLIYSTVWKVVRTYGGDFDELMSEANAAFLDAYRTFDGSSAFTSWLRQRVWYSCVSFVRDRLDERSRYEPAEDVQIADRNRSSWSIQQMAEDLGEDALLVVKLVVETPTDLERVYQAKGAQPRNLRSSIRQYLAEAGWTAARIAESFNEVRRALSE